MAPSRRSPWPFDIVVSGVGLMLGRPNKKGQSGLTAVKAQPYTDQPMPGDISQESASPIVETPHAWDDLSLGLGQQVDTARQQTHKYRNTLGIDCSIGGFIMKGPLINTITPATRDTTNGIQEFLELPDGTLFAMNGRYVQKRVSDNVTTGFGASPVKDFGAGVSYINGCVFTSDSGSPAAPQLYACLNSTNKAAYSADGTTWTAFASFVNIDMWAVGRTLWRASDVNQVSWVDSASDPTVEANWTNANSFRIGDKSFPINRVAITSVGYPIFLKQDGPYTLDEAGQDHRLYSFLEFGASSEDGHYYFQFGNDLHISYGNQHVRLVPTMSFGTPHLQLEPIGPERIVENATEVHGRLTAGVGDGTMFAYVGLYNPDSGDSYLLKFSGWVGPTLQEGKLAEAQRIDAWHGSITQKFTGKKITAMHRTRTGAPTGHYRCYIGFSDGTISWFVLPCVPNPMACSSYLFDNVTDGVLNLPLFHGGHMAEAKSLRGFSCAGPVMTANDYAMWNYKLNPSSSSYTPFNNAAGTQVKFNITPESRADFQTGTSSYMIDLQLVLHNTTTATSPVISVPTLHYAVITPVLLRYQGVVLAGDTLLKRDGRPLRIASSEIRAAMKAAANARSGVTITLPDESTKIFTVLVYGEQLAWDERDRPWDASIPFEIVEYNANTTPSGGTAVYGIVLNLAPYTIADLAAYTIAELDSL